MSPCGSDDKPGDSVMGAMTSDYNQLNQSQSTVWRYAQPLFAQAMKSQLDDEDTCTTSFRVADLGCATGGNSVAPLAFVSSQLVGKPSCALEVFLGDLPQNSWNSVVTTVTPESITQNHDRSPRDTFVYMAGQSFYYPCVPPKSLDLSYSFVAVHWMKSYPADIPSGLYATDPVHVADPQLLKLWRDAGANDFMDFSKARHRELKVGGHFIGVVACPKESGHFPWSRVGVILYDILKKKISLDVLASCVLPCCWRTESDVRAGFPPDDWHLETCEFHQTKDPVREQLERGDISANEYGRAVIQSFRAVCHATCVASLAKLMPLQDVTRLMEEAYDECIQPIGADPELYNLDVSFWYVLARKK